MVIALLTVELHVPGARSLKDKRMVLRRVKDRLKKFNVAVSEVEYHDLWQRAALAVVTVTPDWPTPPARSPPPPTRSSGSSPG